MHQRRLGAFFTTCLLWLQFHSCCSSPRNDTSGSVSDLAASGIEFTGHVWETEFRLSGDASQGYLQVRHEAAGVSWSKVCTDTIDSTVAHALCVRLGYKLACQFRSDRNVLDQGDFNLTMIDANFTDCYWSVGDQAADCLIRGSWLSGNCTTGTEVWLRCATENDELELDLVLEDPHFVTAGHLRARCSGASEWNAVCDEHWDKRDGRVACRQLGFPMFVSATGSYTPRYDRGPEVHVIISHTGCVGTEDNMANCSLVVAGSTCTRDAFVACGIETTKYSQQVGLCGAKHSCGEQCELPPASRYLAVYDCYCDQLCTRLGDCCYDFSDYCPHDNKSETTSVQAQHVGSEFYQCLQMDNSQKVYALVAKCPPGVDPNLQFLCERKGKIGPSNVTSVLPVYDKQERVHYKNVYCAMCHGVKMESITMWKVSAGPRFDRSTVLGLETSYDFSISPPNWSEEVIRTCLDTTLVSTCSPEWQGSHLERACQDFAAVVNVGHVWYRNPYCAMCTGGGGELGDYCDADTCLVCSSTHPWQKCNKICEVFEGSKPPTIEVLFKFQEVSSPEGCLEGELYFPLLQSCRRVECVKHGKRTSDCGLDSEVPPEVPSWSAPYFNETDNLPFDPNDTISFKVYSCLMNLEEIDMGGLVLLQASQAKTMPGIVGSVNLLVSDYESARRIVDELVFVKASDACRITISILIPIPGNFLNLNECHNITIGSAEVFTRYYQDDSQIELVNVTWFLSQHDPRAIPRICIEHDLTCGLQTTLDTEEFRLYTVDNVTALQHLNSGERFADGEFLVLPDGRVHVCLFPSAPGSMTFKIVLWLSLTSLSLVGLVLTFITYYLLPALKNVAGLCIMNFVVALFVANLVLMVSGLASHTPRVCLGLAVFTHMTWLAAFHWMTVMSSNVAFTFGKRLTARRVVPFQNGKTLTKSIPLIRRMVFAWGSPMIIVAICLCFHFGRVPVYATSGQCYIASSGVAIFVFGIPVAVNLAANIVCFVFTAVNLRQRRAQRGTTFETAKWKKNKIKELVIYCRLMVLMGLTWSIGFLMAVIPGDIIQYVYIIVNSLNGCFVFVSLCLTENVRRMWAWRMYESGFFRKSTSTDVIQLNDSGPNDTSSDRK